jgi:hypothetical protein
VSTDNTEYHTVEVYSSLGPTRVMENINKLTRVEKDKVIV